MIDFEDINNPVCKKCRFSDIRVDTNDINNVYGIEEVVTKIYCYHKHVCGGYYNYIKSQKNQASSGKEN